MRRFAVPGAEAGYSGTAECEDSPHDSVRPMRSLIGWLGAFVLGSAGWWLGRYIGIGTAMLLSAIGSGCGLWAGFRWFDENLK